MSWPLGAFTVAVAMRGADLIELQAERRRLAWIDLDADGRLARAAEVHLAHAFHARQLLADDVVGVVADDVQRHGVRGHRDHQHGAVRRVHLAHERRARHVVGQLAAGGVDRRLHVLGGGVDVAAEVELQGDVACDPRLLFEVICVTPAICDSCRSSGVATFDAIVSGLAPGRLALIWMVGASTCGSAATGRRTYAMIPSTSSAVAISEVAIGRRMKGAEMFMCAAALASACRLGRGSRRLRRTETLAPGRSEPWPSTTTGVARLHAGLHGGDLILPEVDRPAAARRRCRSRSRRRTARSGPDSPRWWAGRARRAGSAA